MQNVNLFLVFLEGIFSFFSPCILPILPIYLGMLSNSSAENLKDKSIVFIKTDLFKNTIFFTLGISTTFFILGSSVRALSEFFNTNKDLIMIAGGIMIIVMGLFYIGIIKSSILNREKRFNMKFKKMNILSAYMLGFTFSFGWTPCIGPILASVLIMVSSSESTSVGNILIITYTLGFILPFIITAMFYNKLFEKIDKIKSNLDIIKKIGGIILIVSGIIMVASGFNNMKNNPNRYESNKTENNQSANQDDDQQEGSGEEEKIKALDFTLYDQYGNEHKFSDYEGKTVFLNFWATWCPPCKEEMPYIEELYKEYKENGEDVVILGLASPNLGKEKSKDYITDFLKEEGYTFPTAFDEGGSLVYQYGISAFPSTLIVDKEGYITRYVPGAMNKETMKYLIEEGK